MLIGLCILGLMMAYGGCPGAEVIKVISWVGLIARIGAYIWDAFRPQSKKPQAKPSRIPKKEPKEGDFFYSSDPKREYRQAHDAWVNEQYLKMAATGEYRRDICELSGVLKRRNPHRERAIIGQCVICGRDHDRRSSEEYFIANTTCRDCARQVDMQYRSEEQNKTAAELATEQRLFSAMLPNEVNSCKRELKIFDKRRIMDYLTISYDLMDGVISEEWAADDIAAIKKLTDQRKQNTIKRYCDRAQKIRSEQSQAQIERERAQAIMQQYQ